MRASTVENGILVDLLVFGPDKAENIGRRTNHPPSSVSRSLAELVDDSLVSDKGGGVYELTGQGRQMARSLVTGNWTPYGGGSD